MLLDSAGPIPQFPVGALLREEEFAGGVGANELDRLLLDIQSMSHPVRVIGKISFPGPPQFAHLDDCTDAVRCREIDEESPVAETFQPPKTMLCFFGKKRLSQTGTKRTIKIQP